MQLAGSATDYSSVLWSTSGDGSFNDASLLDAVYTPSPGDDADGSVTLTLTVTDTLPCTGSTSDSLNVSIGARATVDAGEDQDSCFGENVQLAGVATDYSSVGWITYGDGTFDDVSIPNAVYTPGPLDTTSGPVTLTLMVIEALPCSGTVLDSMTVTILDEFVVGSIAGSDETICDGGDPSSMSVNPTGGSGSYMYRWYSKPELPARPTDGSPSQGRGTPRTIRRPVWPRRRPIGAWLTRRDRRTAAS